MINQKKTFKNISIFIMLFVFTINGVYLNAQSDAQRAAEARRAMGTEWAYNLGFGLGLEMLRDANRINYTIVNSTGANIQEVYISLSSSEYWGENHWSSQELIPSGYQVEARSDDVGPYDFLLVDTNGNKYQKFNIRVTSDLVVNFTREDREQKGILDRLRNAWDSFWD